ncbi:hypothetical protein M422DRAFT_267152 [Sphaerobolus stellatus SS14]|uniref:Uncharacterized protein n=1 Tax=Sphaerobolus stellatus (strain SS14) TaxID=990650 RepID=A0A0C9UQ70_SPHS4|nr:hypothetical protein M422DRAFT_267152 [Sphaerobolus stellatus SS14]
MSMGASSHAAPFPHSFLLPSHLVFSAEAACHTRERSRSALKGPHLCSQSSPSTLARFSRSTLSLHQAGAPAVNLPPATVNLSVPSISVPNRIPLSAPSISVPLSHTLIAYPYPNLICLSIRWTNVINTNGTTATF